MNTYIFLKIVISLILPPASLAVGAVAWAALRLGGLRRLSATVLGLAVLQTVAMSFPPVTAALLDLLEGRARQVVGGTPACCYDAIVVLGGSIIPAAPPYSTEPDLTESADRVWYAARLYRAGIAPKVIVSGGSFVEQQGGPATTEAEAMRRFLIDLGVPDQAIVPDGKSLNTIENVRNVRDIVKGGKVAIVTSAYHVPRAARLARTGGLDFAIFGTDWQAPSVAAPWWEAWLPAASALGWSNIAVKELLALAFDGRSESLAR